MASYIRRTVNELITMDSEDEIFEFINQLHTHSEKKEISNESQVRMLIARYYKNNRVEYSGDEDDVTKKIMSWIDCIEYLQKYFVQGINNGMNIGDVKICFEYNTPDGNWMDVILLDHKKMTILEFKSGQKHDDKTLNEHNEQILDYYGKIRHSNKNVWKRVPESLKLEKYLIYTNDVMSGYVFDLDYIIVGNQFTNIVNRLVGKMEDSEEDEIMTFDEEWDSSTLGAFISLLNGELLSNSYIPERCTEYCKNLIDSSKNSNGAKVVITFINGKPGAGKTGVALSLLSEYLQRAKIEKEKDENTGEFVPDIKYATGNGNLYDLFNAACKNNINSGTVQQKVARISHLYTMDDILRCYPNVSRYDSKTKSDVIIVDEAQRMWSSARIAFNGKSEEKNNKYEKKYDHDEAEKVLILSNDLSEPLFMLIDAYRRAEIDNKTVNIIFLIGNGQEINTGEEIGAEQIVKAVKKAHDLFANTVETKVYSSSMIPGIHELDDYLIIPEYKDETGNNQDELYLKTERRNLVSFDSGEFANSLLEKTVKRMDTHGFAVYDTNEFSSVTNLYQNKRRRLLIDSFDQKNVNSYFTNGMRMSPIFESNTNWQERQRKLFDFFCRAYGDDLNVYATEFNTQGLEFDVSYFIWGDFVKWRNGDWDVDRKRFKGQKQYYEYKEMNEFFAQHPELGISSINIDDVIKNIILNTYRVLLTRAQYKTLIFVKDKATREHIKEFIEKCNL